MKKIAPLTLLALFTAMFMFLLLVASKATYAQVGPEVYRTATPVQALSISSAALSTATAATVTQMVELTCTVACFYWIGGPGQPLYVTKTTGAYLPADTPVRALVSKKSRINVIGSTSSGVLYIRELTK